MSPAHRIHGTDRFYCLAHGKQVLAGQSCPLCAVPPRVGPPESRVKRPRAGSDTEAMLAAQLSAAGYFDATFAERPASIGRDLCFRRQVPWGLEASPERGFAEDIGFVFQRVLVAIKGGAHAAGRKKSRDDVEREGLAVSLGWVFLPISPDQVRDGSAVALIAAALAARKEE